jgi:hypothetical protein
VRAKTVANHLNIEIMKDLLINNPLAFLWLLCLAPIVIVETTIAVTEAIRRRRERKEIYKPLKH